MNRKQQWKQVHFHCGALDKNLNISNTEVTYILFNYALEEIVTWDRMWIILDSDYLVANWN